jgi:hypothetical protein
MRKIGLSAFAAALLALGACDGDDSDEPEDSAAQANFAAEADRTCTDAERKRVAVNAKHPVITSAKDEERYLNDLIPVTEDELRKLRDLKPADEARSKYEQYLSARRDSLAATRRARDSAAKGGSAEKSAEFQAATEKARSQADTIGADLGLEACGRGLAQEDLAKIRKTSDRYFISEDPSICTKLVTDRFIKAITQNVEQCKRLRRVETGTKSVKVSDVKGVPGVSARARAVTRGGAASGQPLRVIYVFEDGVWKVDLVSQAPPEPK